MNKKSTKILSFKPEDREKKKKEEKGKTKPKIHLFHQIRSFIDHVVVGFVVDLGE